MSNDANKTIVSLTHQGMGRGSKWDRVYEFFVHAWSRVLFQLDEFLAKKSNATNHKTKPCVCPHHASKESSTSPFTENLNTLANGIKHVGKGHFYVPRKLFDELLSNAKPLLRSARVIPYIKDGTPKGFQLFNIPPGTLYSLLGLQNGDVILAINDFAISTPQEALKAYTKVRKAQKVIVSIKRRGDEKTSKLTYIIIP